MWRGVKDDAGKHGRVSVLAEAINLTSLWGVVYARVAFWLISSGAGTLLSRSIRGASTTSRQGKSGRLAVCNVGTPSTTRASNVGRRDALSIGPSLIRHSCVIIDPERTPTMQYCCSCTIRRARRSA